MKTKFVNVKMLFALFAFAMFASCEKTDTKSDERDWMNDIDRLIEHNLAKVAYSQGLAATVIMEEGNCMPYVSDEPEPNPDCQRYPVQREIYIHEYTTTDQATLDPELESPMFYSHVETQLIKTVISDDEGFFEVELQPGTYSLFIKEMGSLFANSWDNHGGIQPVIIEPDEMTIVLLNINHSAYY